MSGWWQGQRLPATLEQQFQTLSVQYREVCDENTRLRDQLRKERAKRERLVFRVGQYREQLRVAQRRVNFLIAKGVYGD